MSWDNTAARAAPPFLPPIFLMQQHGGLIGVRIVQRFSRQLFSYDLLNRIAAPGHEIVVIASRLGTI
jgi:hypothetical protein